MADVIIGITSNGYRNGAMVVGNSTFPKSSGVTIAPKVNRIAQITTQSGVLDSRFDDVRYYSGDTSA